MSSVLVGEEAKKAIGTNTISVWTVYISYLFLPLDLLRHHLRCTVPTYNGLLLHRSDYGSLDQFIMSRFGHMVSHSKTFDNYQGLVPIQRLLFKWRIVVSKGSYGLTTKHHGFALLDCPTEVYQTSHRSFLFAIDTSDIFWSQDHKLCNGSVLCQHS